MKDLFKSIWPSISLCIIMLGLLVYINYQGVQKAMTPKVDANKELALYQESISGPATDYIELHAKDAIKLSNEYNVPVYMILGTAILESKYGQSKLATDHNNHFGMNGKGVKMKDEHIIKSFKKYQSDFESYIDYCKLWDLPRYADMRTMNGAWDMQAREMKCRGYATNPKYDTLLISIIEQYSLWKLDRIKDGKTIDFVTL